MPKTVVRKAATKAGKPKPATKAKASVKRTTRLAVPTAGALATFVGVPQRPALKAEQSQRLLKPYPGYRAVMDNVARYLREDRDLLELSYDPAEVEARLARAKDLSARVTVLSQVLDGADAERQEEDGFLMKVLVDAVRRVGEQAGVHPELRTKWQEILDFVRKNRPGRPANKPAAAPVTP